MLISTNIYYHFLQILRHIARLNDLCKCEIYKTVNTVFCVVTLFNRVKLTYGRFFMLSIFKVALQKRRE